MESDEKEKKKRQASRFRPLSDFSPLHRSNPLFAKSLSMAIDFGRSFSIREFASKMRSVDVEKSWPFVRAGDELPKEEKERLLPPIICKKYRWWGDELKAATSEKHETECASEEAPEDTGGGVGAGAFGKDEDPTVKICPVCETFTASTMNAVNAHIDSCLSQASKEERRKAKTKAPKKRSIVEIFAVAPQIERQDDDDEDGENGEEDKGRLEREEKDADVLNASSDAGLKVNKRKRKVRTKKDLVDTITKRKNKKKKRRKNKLKIKKNLLKKKKMMMKKKKKKQHSSGILAFSNRLATEKEDIHKLKMPSSIDCCDPQQGSFQNKRSGKEVTTPIGVQTKKLSKIQGLAKTDRHKVKASKSIANMWEETHVLPLQSILKNQAGVSSVQINSSACNSLNGNSKKNQRVQHSDKRVRFSGKDDILGHKKKPCSSIELPQMQCIRKVLTDAPVDSSTKDQSVAGDSFSPDTMVATKVNENEKDDALSVVSVSEEVYSHEDRQFTNVQSPVLHCHDKEKTFLDESVDLNQAVPQYDGLLQFNPGSSISYNPSSIPTVFSPIPKGVTCQMETQEERSIQRAFNANQNFPEQSIFPVARPATFSSLPNSTRNPSSQPFLSCLANEQEPKESYPLQAIRPQDCNGWGLQCQPLSRLTPNNLMDSMHSTSTELKKQLTSKSGPFGATRAVSDPMSICRDKSTGDDFIGLPLNSQGEFVQIHSSGRPGFNQILKKQNTMMASVGSLQVHNVLGLKNTMDHSNMKEKFHTGPAPSLKWLPEGGYLKEIPAKFPIPSRSTSMQGIRRREALCPSAMREKVHSMSHLGLEMNLMNISSSAYGENKQSRRYSEQEKNQAQGNLESRFQPSARPTMRLMGKNVTVGISNKEGHGSEDGNIWIDKEIITENRPISTISGISLARSSTQPELVMHNAAGMSNESEIRFMEAPSTLQVTALGTRPAQTNLNRQTHVMLMNGLPLIDGRHGTDFHPLGQQIPSQAMLHKSSNISENCLSGTEAFKISNQIPITLSNPHGQHLQPILLSSAQCKRTESLTCGATLPFSDGDRREYLPASCAQRSSPSLPPWLQNATKVKEIPYTLTHPAVPNSKREPNAMPGPNFLRQSPNLTPISFPSHSSNTYPGLQNSSTPASLPRNPLIPAFPSFSPTSAIGTSFRNRTMGDKTNAKSTSKNLDVAKKAKKRPAAKTDETTKTTKKPNLAIQEGPNSLAGPQKGEYLHGYARYNRGSSALHDQGDKPDTRVEKDELRTASGTNAFKLDAVARSGPIKLSAGAKHILKPSQNMDQDSSRPTHSTIPFAIVADSSKLPEIQRKTAKIYRF